MSKLALKIQRYCKSLLLLELLKGLAITGRHLFTKKITVFYPEEKTLHGIGRDRHVDVFLHDSGRVRGRCTPIRKVHR